MKTQLPQVTLIGIDCVDLDRLKLAAEISCKDIDFGAVILLSSIKNNDPRVVNIPPINSKEEYSAFMIKEFYKYVTTDFALVFQYDGFVLNANAWRNDFLNYDYIGGPCAHIGNLIVGNGGFSLRSQKLNKWLGKNWKKVRADTHPEDVFIAKFARPFLEKDDLTFAPKEVAAIFSREGNEESVVWNGEFGFHGISYTDISKFFEIHPEYTPRFKIKTDDYVTLMKKYPVFDGTVHTIRYRRPDMKQFAALAQGKRNYEARATIEKYYNQERIKEGNTIIFKRSGVSFKELPIPCFERKVKKVEHFSSFAELRKAYPRLHVTYPLDYLKKWQKPFMRFLGDWAFPKNIGYSVFWF